MSNIFCPVYRELSHQENELMNKIKNAVEALEANIFQMSPSRERSLAMIKLEESVLWAVKGITGGERKE